MIQCRCDEYPVFLPQLRLLLGRYDGIHAILVPDEIIHGRWVEAIEMTAHRQADLWTMFLQIELSGTIHYRSRQQEWRRLRRQGPLFESHHSDSQHRDDAEAERAAHEECRPPLPAEQIANDEGAEPDREIGQMHYHAGR